MTLQAAIADAIRCAEGWADPAPLEAAAAVVASPWRVAVVGRTSVGKSTLLNWLAGGEVCPVGLGGITRTASEVAVAGGVLIDTPGIDDPDTALLTLAPILDAADAVIWVIDGLQPLTATERRVAELVLVDGAPLDLVVAKADLLEPNDRQGVMERVRALSQGWNTRSQRALDLRAASRDRLDPGDMGQPHPPGPRRRAVVLAAVAQMRAQLDALPAAPAKEQLLDAWRDAVRRASDAVDAEIVAGRVQHKGDALAALAVHSGAAIQGVEVLLGNRPGPRLPSLSVPERSGIGHVFAGMSGQEGARRVLKAKAASWLADGLITLQDWAEDQTDLWQAHAQREALRAALTSVEAALD